MGYPIANASITRSCTSLTRTDGTETACDGSTFVTDQTGAFRFAWLPGTAPSLQIQLPGATTPVQVVATQMSFDDLAELTVAIQPF